MNLYHYFEKSIGPFKNLSDIDIKEAENILKDIRTERPNSQAAKRDDEYMKRRNYYESRARKRFLEIGGKPERQFPYTMVVEECEWLHSWYINTGFIKIPVEEFDINTISFTYGDLHPTFSLWPNISDGKEYRHMLYKYNDIIKIIDKYGMPQIWNHEGKLGPVRYIEAQIWSDTIIQKYKMD